MSPSRDLPDYGGSDLNQVIVKPLYFGMLINILLPMAGLFACYYYNQHNLVENRLGLSANSTLWVFGALAFAQAAVALWWRQRRLQVLMVRRAETFEQDLANGLMKASRPVFLLIAAISVWGYLYFFLTGRFTQGAVIVLFSFLVFQVIRPRLGALKKLVDQQRKMLENEPGLP